MVQNIKLLQNCPMILQQLVHKQFDLRITIVGTQVFACEIHSQKTKNEKTKLDYRGDHSIPYKIHNLPKNIESKILLMCKKMNLNLGCVDMVLDTKGNYIFLEINPNGLWLWIEKLTDLPIAKAIAENLEGR